MHVIRKAYYIYRLKFDTSEQAGFMFPCDADGRVDEAALPDEARANYAACKSGAVAVIKRPYIQEYRIPGEGE